MLELSQGHFTLQGRMNSVVSRIASWLQRNRTSVRMAFMLRMVSMTLGIFLGLLWTRLLIRSMGDPVYGLFVSFQGVTRLGGLGDLGLSGAVALIVNTRLGRGEDEDLQKT